MRLTLVSQPAVEPITLDDAKAHLRVEHTEDDSLIEALITSVRSELDGRDGQLNRALITQTWDLTFDRFPWCRDLPLPFPPLQSVTSLKYYDMSNVQQTYSSANYDVLSDNVPGSIRLTPQASWPASYYKNGGVTIRFVAGYGTDGIDVPGPIRQAMLLRLGDLYNNRGDGAGAIALRSSGVLVNPSDLAVSRLLSSYVAKTYQDWTKGVSWLNY